MKNGIAGNMLNTERASRRTVLWDVSWAGFDYRHQSADIRGWIDRIIELKKAEGCYFPHTEYGLVLLPVKANRKLVIVVPSDRTARAPARAMFRLPASARLQ